MLHLIASSLAQAKQNPAARLSLFKNTEALLPRKLRGHCDRVGLAEPCAVFANPDLHAFAAVVKIPHQLEAWLAISPADDTNFIWGDGAGNLVVVLARDSDRMLALAQVLNGESCRQGVIADMLAIPAIGLLAAHQLEAQAFA